MPEGTVFERMARIMSEVDVIGKDSVNKEQGFKYRGADEVLNSLHSIFARHGVFIMPEVLEFHYFDQTTKSGTLMFHHHVRVKFNFYAPDGSTVAAIGLGEAANAGDKSVSKAMTIALKYVLTQGLLIPTEEEKDPDGRTPDPAVRGRKREERQNAAPPAEPDVPRDLAQRNSPAQQLNLAQQRIDEEKAKASYKMLEAFAAIKKELGDKEYYVILGNNGFEKSNQIPDRNTATRIYKQMGERLKELREEKDQVPQ